MAKIIKLKKTYCIKIRKFWRTYGDNVRRRMEYLDKVAKEKSANE